MGGLDGPVPALYAGGVRAHRRAGGETGGFREVPDAVDKAGVPVAVAEVAAIALLLCPGLACQAFIAAEGSLPRPRGNRPVHRLGKSQAPAEVGNERINVQRLRARVRLSLPVAPAPSGRPADFYPVGRLVGRSGKIGGIDERLHQKYLETVDGRPVPPHGGEQHADDLGGKVAAPVGLLPDEKSVHRGEDVVEGVPPLTVAPPEPL